MYKYLIIIVWVTLAPSILFAQDLKRMYSNKWDLERCIDYAVKNNISVREADIQARIAKLQLTQAKLSQIPTASFSSGLGAQFGRSIDPNTNLYTTTQLLYQNMGLRGNLTLYGFGKVRNTINAAEANAAAYLKDVERAGYDVTVSVATYYLQVLAAKEQLSITQIQAEQTSSQLEDTRIRVNAGALPELNLAELEAQLAVDSTNIMTAENTFDQNVLALKGVLNLDVTTPFEVETPPLDQIPLTPIADLHPAYVYKIGLENQALQQVNALRIKSAQSNIKAYKSSLYPTLSIGYDLSTNFSNSLRTTSKTFTGASTQTGLFADAGGGVVYPVVQPESTVEYNQKAFNEWWRGYGDQINNNFGQNVGITLSVPIFNGNTARSQYQQSKLNLKSVELRQEQANKQLNQDIYSAYINAVSSMQKYSLGEKSVAAAQKAYDFASKRYEVGLLSTLDLLVTQNKLLTAKLQQLTNHLDYVFKMKLLEAYKGQGLKL